MVAYSRVGSRPVSNHGNMRDLEPRDLNGADSDSEYGSSIGSNMEFDSSDDEEEVNFQLPEVWENVIVENAPAEDPERIQIPEFIPYPDPYEYGATDPYTIEFQEHDVDTLHVIQHAIFDKLITPAIVENLRVWQFLGVCILERHRSVRA